MKLMTREIEEQIPQLYSQDGLGDEAIVYIKYFDSYSQWKWFATEYDPQDRLFFGYVIGFEKELGYFSLDELESVGRIERDIHFTPITLGEVKNLY